MKGHNPLSVAELMEHAGFLADRYFRMKQEGNTELSSGLELHLRRAAMGLDILRIMDCCDYYSNMIRPGLVWEGNFSLGEYDRCFDRLLGMAKAHTRGEEQKQYGWHLTTGIS